MVHTCVPCRASEFICRIGGIYGWTTSFWHRLRTYSCNSCRSFCNGIFTISPWWSIKHQLAFCCPFLLFPAFLFLSFKRYPSSPSKGTSPSFPFGKLPFLLSFLSVRREQLLSMKVRRKIKATQEKRTEKSRRKAEERSWMTSLGVPLPLMGMRDLPSIYYL